MSLRFRSVRQKLLAGVLLTSVSALLVTGVALFVHDMRTYREAAARDLEIQADLVGRATAAALQFEDVRFAKDNLALLKARPSIRAAALYDARGTLFATYLPEGADPSVLPALPGLDGVDFLGDTIVVFRRIVENQRIAGTVYLATGSEMHRRVIDYAAIVLTVTLAALLVSLALSYWLQAGISKPIVEIAALARRVVEERDYSVRASPTTHDEIGTLAIAFNDMLSEIEQRTAQLENSKRELDQLNEDLEHRVNERTSQLEETNRQLEAFSYSVSHDLRAPLRAIDGFGQALVEDYGGQLNEEMKRYLGRIRSATLRMAHLIDDLLNLSRISRAAMSVQDVDLTALARHVLSDLAQAEPTRNMDVLVWEGIHARADPRLIRVALENLLGNAWKFTSRAAAPHIEIGALRDGDRTTYFVRDNGAGFDMKYAQNLFDAFQRLHSNDEYPGTGIGLATVHRIIHRHGGRVWAHGETGMGATFYFTLGEPR